MRTWKKMVAILAATLMTGGLVPAVAHAQAERIVAPEERDAYVAEFEQDPVVPPVVDGVGGITDEELAAFHDMVRATEAAGEPQPDIVDGQMWSDTVGLPLGVEKADADLAEVQIASEQAHPSLLAVTPASTRCRTFLFSPHQVCGAILDRYESLGGLFSWLMQPTEPMHLNPDGVGYRQRFQNGFIYWHPSTGAHGVTVRTANVWERNGWEQGWLGYPLGGEVPVAGSTPADGELNGWVQLFQGGRIYRTPLVEGAHAASINGAILDRWLDLGGPDSDLGFPLADEARTADGVGRFSVFQYGSIYWHPSHGAHSVEGGVGAIWMAHDAEAGEYGYPISDVYLDSMADLRQDFSKKSLFLSDFFPAEEPLNIDGNEVDRNLVKWVNDTIGVDLKEFYGGSSARALAASQWDPPENGSWRTFDGTYRVSSPVSIIPGYIYDLSHPEKSLHDFCTLSPDLWKNQASMVAADFRGPCSRHDVCYEDYESWNDRIISCDPPLRMDIQAVCRQTYKDPVGACLKYGDFVYGVVSGIQAGKHFASGGGR